jgi:hypothetical protein
MCSKTKSIRKHPRIRTLTCFHTHKPRSFWNRDWGGTLKPGGTRLLDCCWYISCRPGLPGADVEPAFVYRGLEGSPKNIHSQHRRGDEGVQFLFVCFVLCFVLWHARNVGKKERGNMCKERKKNRICEMRESVLDIGRSSCPTPLMSRVPPLAPFRTLPLLLLVRLGGRVSMLPHMRLPPPPEMVFAWC